MSIIDLFFDKNTWEAFYAHLTDPERITHDTAAIKTAAGIIEGKIKVDFNFPAPRKKILKKYRNDKPRTVFTFPEPYQTHLKFLNWVILNSNNIYINKFSRSAIAYIPGRSVNYNIKKVKKLFVNTPYYYKTDLKDFFNQINQEKLRAEIKDFFAGDEKLINFFNDLINIIPEGVGAGLPTAGLLANIYLTPLDKKMNYAKAIYFRYADDILIMAKNKNKLSRDIDLFTSALNERALRVNENKTASGINEVTFLGVTINKYHIRISRKAIKKIKSSIRRRARWFNYQFDKIGLKRTRRRLLKTYLRGINDKLYATGSETERGWVRWYSPLVTSADEFKEIELYLLKKCKEVGGKMSYDELCKLGYKSIVREHFKLKEAKTKEISLDL